MKTLQQKKASASATRKNKGTGNKQKNAGQLRLNEKNVQDTVLKIVNSQLGSLLNVNADSDSDSEIEVDTPLNVSPTNQQQKTYKTQVVILEGVSDSLKKHPARLSRALNETKPNLKISKIRITASNAVLIEPQSPKDCCSLLKDGAFPSNCPLGASVKARLPRENTITHQVIIKGLDGDITEEEIIEMLDRQELPHSGVKRIKSRQRNCDTEMVRLFLKSEEKKKELLRKGILLDQMSFKCVAAKEDLEKKLTFQCYNCQVWNDHKTFQCEKPTKCVICGGPHKKAECDKTKNEAKCCNCDGDHAAWSTFCPSYKASLTEKKSYSAATSQSIKPSLIKEEIQKAMDTIIASIKKQIAVIVAEVVTRAFLDHIFYEGEFKRTGGKVHLGTTARAKSIAKMSTTSVNCKPFHDADCSQVQLEEVESELTERMKSSLKVNPANNINRPSTSNSQ